MPPNKTRVIPPALPPCPDQIPIAKPISPCAKLEIPNNDTNDMATHPLQQGDESKLQQDISCKKRNLTAPDLGNNNQGIDSNAKARKYGPLREGRLVNTKVYQDRPSREGKLMNTKILQD